MRLEVRDKNGNYKFTIMGEFAKQVVKYFETNPEIKKSVHNFAKAGQPKREHVIYQPILEKGIGFKNDIFETVLFYGDFVTVITY